MQYSIRCQNGHRLLVKSKHLGRSIRCPKCNVVVNVPLQLPESPGPVAEERSEETPAATLPQDDWGYDTPADYGDLSDWEMDPAGTDDWETDATESAATEEETFASADRPRKRKRPQRPSRKSGGNSSKSGKTRPQKPVAEVTPSTGNLRLPIIAGGIGVLALLGGLTFVLTRPDAAEGDAVADRAADAGAGTELDAEPAYAFRDATTQFDEDSLTDVGLKWKDISAFNPTLKLKGSLAGGGIKSTRLFPVDLPAYARDRVAWSADSSRMFLSSRSFPRPREFERSAAHLIVQLQMPSLQTVAGAAFPVPVQDLGLCADGVVALLTDSSLGGGLAVLDADSLTPKKVWLCDGTQIAATESSSVIYVLDDNMIQVIDAASGRRLRRVTLPELGTGTSIAQLPVESFTDVRQFVITPNHRQLVIAGMAGDKIRISRYQLNDAQMECEHTVCVKTDGEQFAVSPDGGHAIIVKDAAYVLDLDNPEQPLGRLPSGSDKSLWSVSGVNRAVLEVSPQALMVNGQRSNTLPAATAIHCSPNGNYAIVSAADGVWGVAVNQVTDWPFPSTSDRLPTRELPTARRVQPPKNVQFSPRVLSLTGCQWATFTSDGAGLITHEQGVTEQKRPVEMLRRYDINSREVTGEFVCRPLKVQSTDHGLFVRTAVSRGRQPASHSYLLDPQTLQPRYCFDDEVIKDLVIRDGKLHGQLNGAPVQAEISDLRITEQSCALFDQIQTPAEEKTTVEEPQQRPIYRSRTGFSLGRSGLPLTEEEIGFRLEFPGDEPFWLECPGHSNLVLVHAVAKSRLAGLFLPSRDLRGSKPRWLLIDRNQTRGPFASGDAAIAANKVDGRSYLPAIDFGLLQWLESIGPETDKHLAEGTVQGTEEYPIKNFRMTRALPFPLSLKAYGTLPGDSLVLRITINEDFRRLQSALQQKLAEALYRRWQAVNPVDVRQKVSLIFLDESEQPMGGSHRDGQLDYWFAEPPQPQLASAPTSEPPTTTTPIDSTPPPTATTPLPSHSTLVSSLKLQSVDFPGGEFHPANGYFYYNSQGQFHRSHPAYFTGSPLESAWAEGLKHKVVHTYLPTVKGKPVVLVADEGQFISRLHPVTLQVEATAEIPDLSDPRLRAPRKLESVQQLAAPHDHLMICISEYQSVLLDMDSMTISDRLLNPWTYATRLADTPELEVDRFGRYRFQGVSVYDRSSTAEKRAIGLKKPVSGRPGYEPDRKLGVRICGQIDNGRWLVGFEEDGQPPSARSGIEVADTTVLKVLSANTLDVVGEIELPTPFRNWARVRDNPQGQYFLLRDASSLVIPYSLLPTPNEPRMAVGRMPPVYVEQENRIRIPVMEDGMQVSLVEGPDGVSVKDGFLEWTPPVEQMGRQYVSLKLSVGERTAQQAVELSVCRQPIGRAHAAAIRPCNFGGIWLAVRPDGKTAVSSHADHQHSVLSLIDLETGQTTASWSIPGSVRSLDYDSNTIAAIVQGQSNEKVQIHNADTQEKVTEFETRGSYYMVGHSGTSLIPISRQPRSFEALISLPLNVKSPTVTWREAENTPSWLPSYYVPFHVSNAQGYVERGAYYDRSTGRPELLVSPPSLFRLAARYPNPTLFRLSMQRDKERVLLGRNRWATGSVTKSPTQLLIDEYDVVVKLTGRTEGRPPQRSTTMLDVLDRQTKNVIRSVPVQVYCEELTVPVGGFALDRDQDFLYVIQYGKLYRFAIASVLQGLDRAPRIEPTQSVKVLTNLTRPAKLSYSLHDFQAPVDVRLSLVDFEKNVSQAVVKPDRKQGTFQLDLKQLPDLTLAMQECFREFGASDTPWLDTYTEHAQSWCERHGLRVRGVPFVIRLNLSVSDASKRSAELSHAVIVVLPEADVKKALAKLPAYQRLHSGR